VRQHDAALERGDTSPHAKAWPHAPVHRLDEAGVYMVTAGTYRKQRYLNTPRRLDLVMHQLFACYSPASRRPAGNYMHGRCSQTTIILSPDRRETPAA